MGFFKRLWKGVRKVGRFAGKVIGKVGNVASFLAPIATAIHPVAGKVVSTVARGAQAIGKVANGVNNIMDKGEEIAHRVKPVIDKVREGARAVYKTGIPDKLTGGAVSRVVDKVQRFGQKIDSRGNAALDRVAHTTGRISDAARKLGGIRPGPALSGKKPFMPSGPSAQEQFLRRREEQRQRAAVQPR